MRVFEANHAPRSDRSFNVRAMYLCMYVCICVCMHLGAYAFALFMCVRTNAYIAGTIRIPHTYAHEQMRAYTHQKNFHTSSVFSDFIVHM